MPLERDKILVDNLLACLNLYQTSLVWALTAAVVFFLLTLCLRAPSQSTIPPFSTASNPTTAGLIALALCLVLGSLALTALHRAEAIFMKLSLSRASYSKPSSYILPWQPTKALSQESVQCSCVLWR
jgi:hypothetical protein